MLVVKCQIHHAVQCGTKTYIKSTASYGIMQSQGMYTFIKNVYPALPAPGCFIPIILQACSHDRMEINRNFITRLSA